MIHSELTQRIDALLQQSPFAALSQDLKLTMSTQLQALLANANLVSREEFDAQQAVLERTLQQLSELEQRLAQLEGDATEDTAAPK